MGLLQRQELMRQLISALRRYVFRKRPVDRYRGPDGLPVDFEGYTRSIIKRALPYTMTGPERLYALVQAVVYAHERRLSGAIVECGVWRGGSMMAAAETLCHLGDVSRELYLFDTFEGMPAASILDRTYEGIAASDLIAAQKSTASEPWCAASLDEVRQNLEDTGYPSERLNYVVGRVEETLPEQAPEAIAVLRLDTDWYESTAHELEHLFPRVVHGGVLIIDDYGHWQGARKAVDEYFHDSPVLLHRVDYTCRIAVKMGD